jgi:hypothetical protein
MPTTGALPEGVTQPGAERGGHSPAVGARQPRLGLSGLLVVLPIAAALAAAAGAEPALLVLGPVSTFGLPFLVMIGFWWTRWPGSELPPAISGWADTALIIVFAVLATMLGQTIVSGLDPRGLFDPTPGRHLPAFPTTMPLAGLTFAAMLELTFVGDGWPLSRLPRIAGGALALLLSWLIALVLFSTLVALPAAPAAEFSGKRALIDGGQLAAVLLCLGVWQVWFYVARVRPPLTRVTPLWLRIVLTHVLLIGVAVASYLLAALLLDDALIAALAAVVLSAALLYGLLFERWPRADWRVALLAIAFVSALLFATLRSLAALATFSRTTPEEWVSFAAATALGASTILHVRVGRRWPFVRRESSFGQSRRRRGRS